MKKIKLSPIFSSNEIHGNLIFVNCSIGYDGNINYTHCIQIDNDKYCFICHTINNEYRNNTKIVNISNKNIYEFSIGTGVIDVQSNKNHELWVSYSDMATCFDEGIGINGLNCFDAYGKMLFTYKPGPYICDCNALYVLSESEIVFNAYAPIHEKWNAFIKIKDRKNEIMHEWNECSCILAYFDNKLYKIDLKSILEQ